MDLTYFSRYKAIYLCLCALAFFGTWFFTNSLDTNRIPSIFSDYYLQNSPVRLFAGGNYVLSTLEELQKMPQRKILLWFVPFDDYAMVAENLFVDPFPTNISNLVINSPRCGSCLVTYDREQLSVSDAVVFHGFYPESETEVPEKVNKQQVYVWWSQESAHTRTFFSYLRNYFDWTMTVSRSSDVYSPYASFAWILKMISPWKKKFDFINNLHQFKQSVNEIEYDPGKQDIQVESFYRPKRSLDGIPNSSIADLLKRKVKTSAWISSNCDTPGALIRTRIMDSIENEGFNVEKFGVCADRSFPVTSRWDPAFFEELSTYKFYFSFENSIHCKGYMTEKLWFNALYSGAVPIIWGPDREDVRRELPPKSYILVEDFKTVRDLVKFLQYLNSNDTAYADFLEWRTWVRFLDGNWEYNPENLKKMTPSNQPDPDTAALLNNYARMEPLGFCQLCRKLHQRSQISVESTEATGIEMDEREECLIGEKAREKADPYITETDIFMPGMDTLI